MSLIVKALITALVAAVLALLLGIGAQYLVLADLRHKLGSAKSDAKTFAEERDSWIAVADRRTQDLKAQHQRSEQAEQAVRQLQDRVAELEESYQSIRRQVREAPASDDAPVAPVLRQALEQLP